MNVLCFGDSNTYGYDPRSLLGGRYPKESRWVDILAQKTGWEIINQGENGRCIPDAPCSFPMHTDLVILMLGTNDLNKNRGLTGQGCVEDGALLVPARLVGAPDYADCTAAAGDR